MKNILCSFLLFLAVPVFSQSTVAFPDPSFKNALISHGVDLNQDGHIQTSEAEAVTKLQLDALGLQSLKGIEAFIHLKYLSLQANQLDSLDLRKNIQLQYLDCFYNNLSTLDLSKNSELRWLNCSTNQLTSLDLSQNPLLDTLAAQINKIESLDLRSNTLLKMVDVSHNTLTSLQINSSLLFLTCAYNKLPHLDISNASHLSYLSCDSNVLTSLDVSNNLALSTLKATQNPYLPFICVASMDQVNQHYFNKDENASWTVCGLSTDIEKVEKTSTSLSCFPNPVVQGQSVHFSAITSGSLMNSQGQVILERKNISGLETNLLNPGVYTFLSSKGEITRLIVVR